MTSFIILLIGCTTQELLSEDSTNNSKQVSEQINTLSTLQRIWSEDEALINLVEYQIIGDTPEKLLQELKTKGPRKNPKGGTFFARADWNVRWNFTYEKFEGICHAKNITTRLRLHFEFPKWEYNDSHNAGLIAYWNDFLSNLTKHEIGHGEIGSRMKNKIQNKLSSYKSQEADCKNLGIKLNKIAHGLIKQSGEDQTYDKETKNGTTQGAYFSLPLANAKMDER